MEASRKSLSLRKETLRRLETPSGPRLLETPEMVRIEGMSLSEWLKRASILCVPSAVQSACMTYCPDFTCDRDHIEIEGR